MSALETELRSQIELLQRTLDATRRERDASEERARGLERERDEFRSALAQIERQESYEIEEAKRERDEERAKREEAERQRDNLRASHDYPRLQDVAEIEALKSALAASRAEVSTLTAENERVREASKEIAAEADRALRFLQAERPNLTAAMVSLDWIRYRAALSTPGTEAASTGEPWVVVCHDGNRGDNAVFWRPNSRGYTTNLDEAGRYTEAEAKSHARHGDEESAHRLCDVLPLARPTVDRDTLRTALRAAASTGAGEGKEDDRG